MATPQCQEQWETGGERQWRAWAQDGGAWLARHVLVGDAPPAGDYPETWWIPAAEWETWRVAHALEADGTPTAVKTQRRAAWRKIRRMANGTDAYTEANVRDTFGAIRRILQDLAEEVQE